MSDTVEADIAGSPKQHDDAVEEEDPDLEDGEIDDDDDDEDVAEPAIAVVAKDTLQPAGGTDQAQSKSTKVVPLIDLASESTALPPLTKSKKSHVDDDHASSIEQAIASALKKKGIEPPMPKLKEPRSDTDCIDSFGHGQSRSSRRRKRKRQRDELEKEKERKNKRMKFDSAESAAQKALNMLAEPAVDEDDPDDYEMMNVRGGSPPPAGSVLLPTVLLSQKYDTDDDSCNSYDSYASQQQHRYESRRSNKSKESRKSRRERARAREDRDERNGRSSEKRSRPESQSEESKHRQEPRKLELCKFYLMECCAKKDKCSYMHSDFPCKYYYLGMDCVQGDQCKFSHGKPLTEQLRTILLKHLETAPKEILGAFKRVCRDTAISQMATRHAELCKKFDVENKLPSMTTSNSGGSRGGGGGGGGGAAAGGGGGGGGGAGAGNVGDHHHHHQQQQQQQKQSQSHLQTHKQTQAQQQPPQIPSLLDIIIKPPTIDDKPPAQKEKQRKSRWCDANSSSSNNINNSSSTNNISTSNTSTASSCGGSLELKNLAGLVNTTIIEKLSQVGVVNLEQVNQLRFGQLTKIGVTIADISELQMKAQGFLKSDDKSTTRAEKPGEDKISTNRDVDMRFIPSGSNAKMPQPEVPDSDMTMCSSSNSNSNSGVVLVDYSQYLKDSNLAFDRGDLFDDEKDEEQLVIDYDLDTVEDAASASAEEQAEEDNYTSDPLARESPLHLLHSKLNLKSDSPPKLTNPFTSNLYKQQDDDSKEQRDPRSKQATTPSIDSIISASFIGKFNPFRTAFEEKKSRPDSPEAPVYERTSMYDFNPKYADENSKTEKNKRLTNFSVPFQPAPANEIDASVTSHLPIQWKLYDIDVPRPTFGGNNFTSNQTIDPRVRRILGLAELPKTNTAAALSRGRTPSTSIASPDSTECSSPSYYTPPSSSISTQSTVPTANIYTSMDEDREKPITNKPAASASRLDPRRAAAAAAALSASSTNKPTSTSVAQQQNIEIRNLLQKSEWYKNLNSTTKIMVNQQLALVSTELKKYHQDTAPDKVFDTQFIVSNPTLQQILTSLGIFIDYNGVVSHIENDNENQTQSVSGNILQNLNQMPPNMRQQLPFMQQQHQQCIGGNNMLPNLNQMPPNLHQVSFMQQQQQQMEFMRGPPPGMPPPLNNMQFMPHPSQHMAHMSAFAVGPSPNDLSSLARPSLLGMPPVLPPVGNPFNQPFSNVLLQGPEFGNLRGGQGMQQHNMQRNFNNSRHNRNQRQQNNNN